MTATDKIRLNSIASNLLWLWGALVLFGGLAIGYPVLVSQGNPAILIGFGVWGVATCLAAFSLRKRRWGARWWGGGLCVISALTMLVIGVKLSLLGLLVNVAVLVLILMSWQIELQQVVPADGPRPSDSARG